LKEEKDIYIVLGDLECSEKHRDFGYCRCLKVDEVKCAINRMIKGRATEPDKILVEFWKSTNMRCIEWLTCCLMSVLRRQKCLKNGG